MRVSLSQQKMQCFLPSCAASDLSPTGISSSGSPPTQNVSSCMNHSFPGDENTCTKHQSDQNGSIARSCCHDDALQYPINFRRGGILSGHFTISQKGASIPTNCFRSSTTSKAKLQLD